MNRLVLIVIIFVVLAIWFSAFANACAPRSGVGGFFGPSFGPPIFIGGGDWNRGGWDRGTGSSGGSSIPSPGRSSGGTGSRGGGISGGSGGK